VPRSHATTPAAGERATPTHVRQFIVNLQDGCFGSTIAVPSGSRRAPECRSTIVPYDLRRPKSSIGSPESRDTKP
jgi:hypothetical protein